MTDLNNLYAQAEQKYNLPPGILASIAQNESSGNPSAVSPQGATGLMQIMPANYKALGITNPTDPVQSINGAAQLLAQNLRASGGDIRQAVTMYHGGNNPANYGPKTNNYEAKVMATFNQGKLPSFAEMDAKYGGSATPSAQPGITSMPSFDQMNAKYGASSAPSTPPTMLQSIGRGLMQGVHDVIDYPAEQLAKGADAIGLTGLLGAPNAAQTQQADTTYRNQFNQNYQGNLPAQISRVGGQVAASVPILAAGGNLLNGALGGVSAAAGEGTAANVINGARNLLSGTAGQGEAGITGLATRTASRALQGGTAGAAASLLTAPSNPDAGSNLQQAKFGGSVGALANGLVMPALGYVGAPIVKGAGAILSRLNDVSPNLTNRGAVNALTKAFANDGMTLEQGLSAMRGMGDQATLADAGGRNVNALAQVVANTPGQGQQTASYLLDRADQAPDLVSQSLQNATGQTGNIQSSMDELMAQRSKAAQPLYSKAFSNPVPIDPRLKQFLDDPDIQAAMARGIPLARREALANGLPFDEKTYLGDEAKNVAADLLDANGNLIHAGDATAQVTPSMQALDAAKRGLDSMIEDSANRDPLTGAMNAQGRSLSNLRSAFLNHLDAINPDYAAARNAWAGPSQAMQAMKDGSNFLKASPDEIASVLKDMPESNVPFYLNGVTSALQNKVDATPDGANVVRKIFGTPAIREKLQAAFNNQEAYDRFASDMENQARFASTKNSIMSGSQTYQRLANALGQGATDYTPHMLNAITGNPGGGIIGAARQAYSNFLVPSQNQLAARGNLLFNPDAQAVQSAIEAAKPGFVRNALNNALTAARPGMNLSVPLGLQYNMRRNPAQLSGSSTP